VAERAKRVEFVPISLDPGEVTWAAPGHPRAAFRRGRSGPLPQIPLPESPALVCQGGVVVQANLAAVQLAGRWLPDSLTGLPLRRLLTDPHTDTGTDAELVGPGVLCRSG
jgi:hypothetical protein